MLEEEPPPPPDPLPPEPLVGVGEGEEVDVGEGEEVDVGDGEGEEVDVGEGEEVGVGNGEGEEVDVGEGEEVDVGEGEEVGEGLLTTYGLLNSLTLPDGDVTVTVTVPIFTGIKEKFTIVPSWELNIRGADASVPSSFLNMTVKSQLAFPLPTIVKSRDLTFTNPAEGPES